MTTTLEQRLRKISDGLTREIAGIVSRMTIDELAGLSAGGGAASAKAREKKAAPETRRKKTRPAPKVEARRKVRPAPKPEAEAAASDQTLVSIRFPCRGKAGMGAGSTESTSIRHSPQGDGGPSAEPPPSPPVPARVVPPPEDRAVAFLRAERERLESAVVKFVEQNPETDAEIVSQRVGLQKGKAQAVLDDLVLKGRLRMKSGQHGRCYVGVEHG